jgi:hypothetical protein
LAEERRGAWACRVLEHEGEVGRAAVTELRVRVRLELRRLRAVESDARRRLGSHECNGRLVTVASCRSISHKIA